jgi:hypothetical protein
LFSNFALTLQRAVWPKPGKQRKISTASTAISTYSMTFPLGGRPTAFPVRRELWRDQSFEISLVLALTVDHFQNVLDVNTGSDEFSAGSLHRLE